MDNAAFKLSLISIVVKYILLTNKVMVEVLKLTLFFDPGPLIKITEVYIETCCRALNWTTKKTRQILNKKKIK